MKLHFNKNEKGDIQVQLERGTVISEFDYIEMLKQLTQKDRKGKGKHHFLRISFRQENGVSVIFHSAKSLFNQCRCKHYLCSSPLQQE